MAQAKEALPGPTVVFQRQFHDGTRMWPSEPSEVRQPCQLPSGFDLVLPRDAVVVTDPANTYADRGEPKPPANENTQTREMRLLAEFSKENKALIEGFTSAVERMAEAIEQLASNK